MPKMLDSRNSSILIVDEAHQFDDVVSNFISVKITETSIKKLKLKSEKEMIGKLRNVKKISDYISFLKELSGEVAKNVGKLKAGMDARFQTPTQTMRDIKVGKVIGKNNNDIKKMKLITDHEQLLLKIEIFLEEHKTNPNNWVMESNWNEKTKKKELSLEPIWASEYLDKYVFSRYDMVFLMSGTILDKRMFCDLNGLDMEKTVYYSINSPFSIKNRPIYYMPIGKMSYRFKEDTFKKYVPILKKILKKYEGKKGLIHTNSFELASGPIVTGKRYDILPIGI
jgi:Rad3-related DNA helicase